MLSFSPNIFVSLINKANIIKVFEEIVKIFLKYKILSKYLEKKKMKTAFFMLALGMKGLKYMKTQLMIFSLNMVDNSPYVGIRRFD